MCPPVRVIMRVLACAYVNYFMHVRTPLVPFPLSALAVTGVLKAGERKVAIKESSYFAPHEEKQRIVDFSTSLRFSSPFCFQGRAVTRNCFSKGRESRF